MRSAHDARTVRMRRESPRALRRRRVPGAAPMFPAVSTLMVYLIVGSCLCISLAVAQDGSMSSAPSSSATRTTTTTSSTPTSSDLSTITVPSLPYTTTLPAINASNPALTLAFPSSASLYITLNICTLGRNASLIPQALLSSSSPPNWALGRSAAAPQNGGAPTPNEVSRSGDPLSLTFNSGFANSTWTSDGTTSSPTLLIALGLGSDGIVALDPVPASNGDVILSLSVFANGPANSVSPAWLRLGDTTPNSVLLFSPLLEASPQPQPSYPNYTLPGAQLSPPAYQGAQTKLTTLGSNLSLIIVPTSSFPAASNLGSSLCAVRAASSASGSMGDSSNMIMTTTRWTALDDTEGYRTMWVVGGLSPDTNYTAWMVDSQGGISQPIWFATKEDTFPCQLALPSDMCPGIGYAAPLPANETTITVGGTAIAYPVEILPSETSSLISSSLQAFSTSLLSTACGRDLFSHVSSCLDCYSAYRDWLCRITVPQCASGINKPLPLAPVLPQTVFRPFNNPRIEGLNSTYDYTELLPCISTCTVADRRCPVFLTFRCPRRRISTANQSYAFLGGAGDSGDGTEETGPPALDRWGNRWCNG